MNTTSKRSLLIAAPSSGSGKTVFTLALLRALKNAGVDVASAKAGPDYIDPAFHSVATGVPSINLDPWAMTDLRYKKLALSQPSANLVIEGMMGLYDGAADGTGSAAQLAVSMSTPVLLIVDAAKQSHSIAALVRGFRDHDPNVVIAGVILNKVGSPRHGDMLQSALAQIDVETLGVIYRDDRLSLPERHLGLVQAGELENIEAFIDQAALIVSNSCNLEKIINSFGGLANHEEASSSIIPPLGQAVAIAQDEAFSFIYPHLLSDWRAQGAQISFFSPLNDEAPAVNTDAVYLPGGYPELHAGKISNAQNFITGMQKAAASQVTIYGECGGYMALGEGLIDAKGDKHSMTGLLALETSFEKRKLHLGYRELRANNFIFGERLKAHEFHYTSAVKEKGEPLFEVHDALGNALGSAGLRSGSVMGSYMHVIDRSV